jgi:hypothetical protein
MVAQTSLTHLIDSVGRLNEAEFDKFFKNILLLRAQRHPSVLPKEESDLLIKINRGFSERKWSQLEFLNEKLETEGLGPSEHETLMHLVNEYEKYMVQRARNLARLAVLRNIPIDKLIDQLGLAPV